MGARDESGIVVGYLNEQGQPEAWTGDENAPYVNAIPTPGSTGQLSQTSNATLTAPVSSIVIKASPGTLYQVYFYNNNAATRYLFIINDTIAPSIGDGSFVPNLPVPGGGWADLDFGVWGLQFSKGIGLGCSSTALTFAAAADGIFTGLYL